MSNKPLIESIRDYISAFPDLSENCCLLIDYLGDKPVEYTVEAVPCDPVYKEYVDGEKVKQFLFVFASREYFEADVNTCIENLHFYENFEEWIEQNNDNGVFPDLGSNRTPVSLEVLTRGYVLSADEETARYQIQLRLVYEEE
jgi:hypothetical protein